MKRILLSLAFLGLTGLVFAQKKGINFQTGLNWQGIKGKAKMEKKYIFVDVFATWCGPCKVMDREVYSSEKVGAFMNNKFISVKVQADKTNNDGTETRSWYNEASTIVNNYQVGTFPSFLFFSPAGKLIHRGVGYKDEQKLIDMADESMDLYKQYDSKIEMYKKGELRPSELKELALTARNYGDLESAEEIAGAYIKNYLFKLNESELFVKEHLIFMSKFIGSPDSKIFGIFTVQSQKVNSILGDHAAQTAVMNFIGNTYIPKQDTWKTSEPDWINIEKKLTIKFGALGNEKISEQRMLYCIEVQDWRNYGIWYVEYLRKYLRNCTYDPNYLSWKLFEHVDDQKILKFACDSVMPYAIEKWYPNDFQVYDTYANLLYKIGKRNEAIDWEMKALKLSNGNKSITETLDKMNSGKPTWPLSSNKK